MIENMFGQMTHKTNHSIFIYLRMGTIAEATRRKENMTLLIPDRNKESQEDFIWALPVEHMKWKKWYELSKKFKTTTPMHVRYMTRMEDKQIKTIVLLPTEQQTDDDAKTAAAWLRMVKQLSCRIYVIRAKGEYAQPMSKYELINAVMGIDPDTLTELEDDKEEGDGQAAP
jgi:hypothetical protein